jgi:methionyl-tRNA synthetase
MLKARQEGVTPEELIARIGAEQARDFAGFGIGFDNFYTTHSRESRELTERIYLKLVEGGHIRRESIRQAYDEQAGMFLPDRYVRGRVPQLRISRPIR